MDPVQVAVLVLVAVALGMMIPLLFQVYSLVSSARQILDKSSRDIEAAMKGVHQAVDRIDRITEKLEAEGRIDTIMDGLTDAAQVATQMKGTLQTATSVAAVAGPALAAAVQAFRAGMDGPAARKDDGSQTQQD